MTGFVSTSTYQQASGIELLRQDGGIANVSYGEIKTVCFVRDFEAARDPVEGKIFQTRPKMEGLWLRMQFRDGEMLDGVLPNNLLLLEPQGFTVTPPEPYSNNQRVFVPREALTSIQVVGVVGSPLRKTRTGKAKPDAGDQPRLFE